MTGPWPWPWRWPTVLVDDGTGGGGGEVGGDLGGAKTGEVTGGDGVAWGGSEMALGGGCAAKPNILPASIEVTTDLFTSGGGGGTSLLSAACALRRTLSAAACSLRALTSAQGGRPRRTVGGNVHSMPSRRQCPHAGFSRLQKVLFLRHAAGEHERKEGRKQDEAERGNERREEGCRGLRSGKVESYRSHGVQDSRAKQDWHACAHSVAWRPSPCQPPERAGVGAPVHGLGSLLGSSSLPSSSLLSSCLLSSSCVLCSSALPALSSSGLLSSSGVICSSAVQPSSSAMSVSSSLCAAGESCSLSAVLPFAQALGDSV